MGSIYKRGKVWWIKYYRDGKPYRESTGTHRKRDADRLLKQREGAIANGTFSGIAPEKTTLEELAEDLLNDYRMNGKKNTIQVENYLRRLVAFFAGSRAQSITTDRIRAYIAHRQGEVSHRTGRLPAPATINRELSALRRMFNLGRQAGKIVQVPHVPLLKENNVRKGFFHHRDYLRLKEAAPPHLRPIVTLAYFSGMRRGEILRLRWDQVDFQRRLIRLEPGTTKNREARIVPMSGELLQELQQQRQLRDSRFPGCPFLFFDHRTGKPLRSIRRSWTTACKKIGLPDALFHDFRRTGVRNLVRAGVPDNVAMSISGHKTRSVFDRYDIVDEADVQAAGEAVERYLENSTGTIRAQIAEFEPSRLKQSHR